jgi:alkanesulfonate monooxygenase SsuD/methylene tetrahydromethanopterin reductase-like flavin-dependent oxidoreductase (luciferase family)
MTQLDLLLPEGKVGNYGIQDTIDLAQAAESAGFHTVWKGESYSTNALMNLSAIAARTERIRLGTGITNVFSRSPALIAMSVATLDKLAPERATLGLGVSTEPVITAWYGVPYDRPLRRTKELIEVVREIFETDEISYDGDIFDIGPYPVGFSAEREGVPIYNAAMGSTNCRLTGEYADGWLPVFTPPGDVAKLRDGPLQAGAAKANRSVADITVTPVVTTAIADTDAEAKAIAKRSLAQAMSVGYNGLVERFGFGGPGDAAAAHWREGNRAEATQAIPDEMVDALAVYATPGNYRSRLDTYIETAGADRIAVMPPYTATPNEISQIISVLEGY